MTQPEESLQPLTATEISLIDNFNTIISESFVRRLYSSQDAVTRNTLRALINVKIKELKGRTTDFDAICKSYEEEMYNRSIDSNVTAYTNAPDGLSLLCADWECNDLEGVRDVSKLSILPTAIYKDVTDDSERVKIAYRQPLSDEWNFVTVTRRTAQDSRSIMALADKGFDVNSDNAKELSRYLSDVLTLNRNRIPVGRSVPRVGWYKGEFLPYGTKTHFNGEDNYKTLFDSICESGDFGLWKKAVADCTNNSTQVKLILAASFASVLMSMVGVQPFIVHLHGGTGKGKTVALMIAASVWGNPRFDGMVHTLNMTVNAMCETMAFLHDIPLIGDELQTIKTNGSRNYDSLIMQICEGKSRSRMSYDKMLPAKTWSNIAITSGEEPITRSNSGGGAKNRVIEIELDRPISDNFSELADTLRENYGFAGKLFVENLNKSDVKSAYNYNLNEIKRTCQGRSEKQYIPAALMRTAYRLADTIIFNGELSELKAEDFAPYLFEVSEVSASERAYAWLCDHIDANRNRFDTEDNYGEVWGHYEQDRSAVMFNKSILERELNAQGYDFNAVKKDWANKGYLERNTAGRYVYQTHTNGEKSRYVRIVLTQSAYIGCQSVDENGF